MSTESNGSKGSHRFQFRLRTLLFVITGACVLFGMLEFVIPDSIPIGYRIALYATYSIALAFAAWRLYESKRHPWKSPTEFVMVKVDAKWKRRVKSPLIIGPIAALTGVSLSFAPLMLVWLGQAQTWGVVEWIVASLSFLVIYFVPGFYMKLASEVIAELIKSDMRSDSSS